MNLQRQRLLRIDEPSGSDLDRVYHDDNSRFSDTTFGSEQQTAGGQNEGHHPE
jgi:hypothetical protein